MKFGQGITAVMGVESRFVEGKFGSSEYYADNVQLAETIGEGKNLPPKGTKQEEGGNNEGLSLVQLSFEDPSMHLFLRFDRSSASITSATISRSGKPCIT